MSRIMVQDTELELAADGVRRFHLAFKWFISDAKSVPDCQPSPLVELKSQILGD